MYSLSSALSRRSIRTGGKKKTSRRRSRNYRKSRRVSRVMRFKKRFYGGTMIQTGTLNDLKAKYLECKKNARTYRQKWMVM